MNAAGVRDELVRRLRRNLVGPSEAEDADLAAERLPAGESPSRWYLTGFIAPSGEPSTENETREPPKDSTTERWKSSDARAAATAAGGCGMDC